MPLRHVPPRPRIHTTVLLLTGLLITVAFAGIFISISSDIAKSDYNHALRSAKDVVGAFSSDVEKTLTQYDLSLRAVVDGMRFPEISEMKPSLRQALLFDRAATAKNLGSINVLDRDGVVRLNSRILNPQPEDFSAHEFFQVHRRQNSPDFF